MFNKKLKRRLNELEARLENVEELQTESNRYIYDHNLYYCVDSGYIGVQEIIERILKHLNLRVEKTEPEIKLVSKADKPRKDL